jgi:hypothetical protein
MGMAVAAGGTARGGDDTAFRPSIVRPSLAVMSLRLDMAESDHTGDIRHMFCQNITKRGAFQLIAFQRIFLSSKGFLSVLGLM